MMQDNHSNMHSFAPMPLLEVKNLSVDYLAGNGTVHALTDVSISLARGQILGLAGESGSGKTTLGYAITRLLRPPAVITGGTLLYHPAPTGQGEKKNTIPQMNTAAGEPVDILQLAPPQLRAFRWNTLAIVFQSAMNALNPVLTLGTQIEDVLRYHRPEMSREQRRARVVELLKLVGIAPDRIRSYPHELSGGMRQRSIIAMALALSPEVVIMDEPTTALDVVVQREILTELIRLREQLNFSIIFITHDLSLLLELADSIAIMYAGRVVETATCRELQRQPRHPYSYGMLHSFPSLHGPRQRMTGIPGSPPDLRGAPAGCAFHPRCPFAISVCSEVLPTLKHPTEELAGQLVACHMYNPALTGPDVPTNADFAQGYEAAYAARKRQVREAR